MAKLKILHVEDSLSDAELILEKLKEEGFDCDVIVVEKKDDFINKLTNEEFNLILFDFNLQSYNGFEALKIVQQYAPQTPSICISGTVGEENTAELLRLGATDYVLKSNLKRLAFVVRRALEEIERNADRKKAEESLTASELSYRRLFESAKDGILILDAGTGMIVDVNPFLIKLLGFSKEQFINKAIWEIGYFKDIIANKDKFLELQQKEYVRYEDLPLETAEGKKIHVEFVSNVYLANNQKIIQCNIRDITERFHAQEERKKALKEIEMISRFPMENPNPILRFNNDCVLLYANEPAMELVSFCGCEIGHIAPSFVSDLMKEVINKGTNQTIEMQFGDKLWLMTFVPIIADAYVNLYCVDITERKKAEETLVKLRKAVDTSSEAIYLTDKEGIFTYINPGFTALYGYDSDEIVGISTPRILKSGKMEPQFYDELWKTLLIGQEVRVEFINKGKDGKLLDIESSANPIFDEANNIIGFLGIQHDITERKQAEVELKESEEKYRFLADNSSENIWTRDLNLKYTYISPSIFHLIGYTVEEEMERTVAQCYTPKTIQYISQVFAEEMELEQKGNADPSRNRIIELEAYKKDGSIVFLETSMTFLRDDKLIPYGIYGITRDITERKLAEETIKQNYDFLKNVINSFSQPFYVINISDYSIVLANTAATNGKNLEMTGYCYSLSHNRNEPCTGENDKCPLMEVIKTKEPVVVEHIHFDKDGNERIVEVHGYPIIDENEEVFQLIEYSNDITERKQAEEDLRESEERYSTIVNNSPDIILIHVNGIIKYVNNIGEILLEYSIEEVIGKSVLDFVSEESKPKVIANMQRRADGEDTPSYEAKIITKSGAAISVLIQAAIIHYQKEKAFLVVLTDITEIKRAEEALSKSEYEFRMLAEAMPQIVWITRADGWNIYFSQQWIDYTGQTQEESNGHGWNKPFHPDDQQKAWDAWQNATINGGIYSIESRLRRADGIYKWWLVRGVPVIDESGTILKWFGTCTDIDDLKKNEQELILAKNKAEEMNRLKSSFLANMSHELRTPMIGILGFSKLLAYSEDADTKETGELIYTSGKRLMETLNLILDLSRIEAGESKLEPSDIDLIEEIAETVNLYQAAAIEKNLLLSFNNIQYVHLYTRTDKKAIDSILNNLINNAVKYTNKGSITVTVAKEKMESENWVVIEVADTGIGIDEKNINMIFREFRQVSEGLERSFDGTGLGLTLTKKYTELIGGTISVKSKINEGSTFTVRFPIIPVSFEDDDLSQEEEIENIVKDKGITQLKNILIVEDDQVTIIFIQRILKDKYNMDTAMNAMEALDHVEKKQYDLILMDINLGRSRNGIYTTKEIRKMDNYKNTPIIAMTAYAMKGDKEGFLASGCSYYISKPFESDELIALMEEALGSTEKINH